MVGGAVFDRRDWTSSVTFLSVPGKSFAGDLRFLQLPIGYIVGRVAVARTRCRDTSRATLTAYEVPAAASVRA